MKGLLPRLFIAALPVALVIVAACDGGDDEEYFERLRSSRETMGSGVEKVATQRAEAIEAADTAEEGLVAFRDFIAAMHEEYRQYLAALEGIDPPPSMRVMHDDLVGIVGQAERLFENVDERVQQAETVGEWDEIIGDLDPAWIATASAELAWCHSLQERADDLGVDVDLACTSMFR